MKILVTGATGYIGSHVVKSLFDKGHTLHATDYNIEQNDVKDYAHVFKWDIRYPIDQLSKFDKVVHIAAQTKVPNSVKDPYNYYLTNVIGTKNVIDSVPHNHFIYCSTGSAFDPASNPYAATKWGGELITQQFCPKYSLVRFYNVSGNNGFLKYDDDVSHLIRKAARVANAVKDRVNEDEHGHMSIYGTNYNTRDGTCIRNYTHIVDIVDGLVRIVEADATNMIECLGSPDGVSVKEVIDTMKRVSGINFKVLEMPNRPGDIAVSTVPEHSQFFTQTKTLEDMCIDALEVEK
jgi:UDP-glucose 4-epimerase|tara:strand:+ start:1862 stop:2737 length:876 start_codon:yes stop_codon:yes gene_type:complete